MRSRSAKGQRYLTVVVDHDTGRLVWAHPGRDRKTVEKFLDLLGKDRCEQIELVSCDDADWITRPVAERCPNADRLPGPVSRRQGRHRRARRGPPRGLERRPPPRPDPARPRAQRRPVRAVEEPRATSPSASSSSSRAIQQINQRLYRAYLLAQQLRQIYRVPADACARAARRVAEVGPAMPARAVRQARPPDHRAARQGRGGDHQQALQRPRRAGQHPDPADHPPRVRLPLTLGRHRPRDALTRRPLPTPTRPVTPPTVPAGDSFFGPPERGET